MTLDLPSRSGSRIGAVVVFATVVMLVLLELHVRHLNGPWYGVVYYRRLPALRVYPLMLLATIPTLIAAGLFERARRGRLWLLAFPMIGTFLLRVLSAAVAEPRMQLHLIANAVRHPGINSYYIDAVALSNFHDWLGQFPQIMRYLNMHSETKPPGSILFYLAFVRTLGHSPHTALVAVLTIGALASVSIPMSYL